MKTNSLNRKLFFDRIIKSTIGLGVVSLAPTNFIKAINREIKKIKVSPNPLAVKRNK
ncbi:MAG: hypothetical protein M0P71_00650 [Melioribacteraceae bacterium]|nr:hypothetical protein [Melioribacteraceae bacterium]